MPNEIGSFVYPYANISVPNGIPFYPNVVSGQGADTKVSFNQGYIFDYQNIDLDTQTIKKIKVEDCSGLFDAQGKYFLEVTTEDGKSSNIASAKLIKAENGTSNEQFHYASKNLPDGNVYSNGQGKFCYPFCVFDEKGGIQDLYIRENIHWQKTNHENVGNGEKVLYEWGDGASTFNGGTLKFRSIEGVSGVSVSASSDGKTIQIGISEDSSSSGGSGDSGSFDSSKTAILKYGEEYIGFGATESPEHLFIDIIDVNVSGRLSTHVLDPEFVSSCESGSLAVVCAQGVDRHCRAIGKIKGSLLTVECFNWFKPKKVKVFICGKRRNHSERYKRYAREQWISNNKFYSKAHSF
jgi:hypothetical protein